MGERGEDSFMLLSRRVSSPPYSSTASTQHDVVMARFDTVGSKLLKGWNPSLSCPGQILVCILLLSSFSVSGQGS